MMTTTRHSTIWIFAEIMKQPGTVTELCERFGTRAPTLSATFKILRRLGLIYVREWKHQDTRTVKWTAVWDAQTTPFEHKDAPKPISADRAMRLKRARRANRITIAEFEAVIGKG